jgi:thiol-disulfide isomerase/thioredoxin
MVFALLLSGLALAEPEMIPVEGFAAAKGADSDASALEIPLRDGGTFKLAEHKGQKVLLSFWASWCTPCRRELPALAIWAKTHKDITILAVNVDRGQTDANKFLDAVHFDLPVAFDPDAAQLGHFGVTSMPTMFLFDGKGSLVWRHTGFSEEKGFTDLETFLAGGGK